MWSINYTLTPLISVTYIENLAVTGAKHFMQLSLPKPDQKNAIFHLIYSTCRSRIPPSNPSLGLTHHITRLFIQVLYPLLPFGFKFFKELLMVREWLVILVTHNPFLFKFCPRTVDNINIRAVSHLALSFVMSPRCLRSAGGIFLFKFFRLMSIL